MNTQSVRRLAVLALVRVFQLIRIVIYRCLFSDNKPIGQLYKVKQPVQIVGRGSINLGAVVLGVWPSPGFLSGASFLEARAKESSIEIGDGTVINNNFSIIADRGKIRIGQRCLIGNNFFCVDSDFHVLDYRSRGVAQYKCRDVFIGDDVFIGSDVKVLKGVTIGDGAVVGAGSVVVCDIPELSVFAGVPARFIKFL